jgi:hypothetical protein
MSPGSSSTSDAMKSAMAVGTEMARVKALRCSLLNSRKECSVAQ